MSGNNSTLCDHTSLGAAGASGRPCGYVIGIPVLPLASTYFKVRIVDLGVAVVAAGGSAGADAVLAKPLNDGIGNAQPVSAQPSHDVAAALHIAVNVL